MDWKVVLEQRVGTYDVKLSVLEPRQFAFGLDVRPGDEVPLPIEAALRSVSEAKSNDQRSFGRVGTSSGARVPVARLRPRRRRTARPSSL